MKKRTSGEGTIVKDRNRWRGQIRLPNGKRMSVSGATRIEVSKQLDQIKRDIAAGLHGTLDGEQTLRQWADQWIESQRHHIAVTTEDSYRSIIRHHFDKIGDVPLSQITPAMLHKHYARKLIDHSSTTVNHIHNVFNGVLEAAVNLDIIARNPAARVKAPPIKSEEFEPLTEEQARSLLQIARGHRFETEIMLALATGAREAELLGLRWQDVFWNQKSVRIHSTLKRLHGRYFLKEPKSRSGSRTIPIGDYVLALLQEQLQRQTELKELLGKAWQDKWNLVFTCDDGTPIHRSVLTHQSQRLMVANGLPKVRFHDLRHTFATLMIERGVNMKTVSEYLGHSSVDITQRIYGHVTPKMRGTLINEINELMPLTDFIPRIVDSDIKQ